MTSEHQAAIYAREAEQAAIRGSHTKAEALLAKCQPWSQTPGPVTGLCTLARAEIAFRQSRFAQASVLGELAANVLAKCGRTQDALRAQEIQPRVWSRDGDDQRVVARSQSLLERWETLADQEAMESLNK